MKKFLKRNKRYFLALVDAFSIAFSYCFVIFIIRQDFLEEIFSRKTAISILLALFVYLSIQYMLNAYKQVWLYASTREYILSFFGCALSIVVVSTMAVGLNDYLLTIKYQFVSGLFSMVFIVGNKASIKIVFYLMQRHLNTATPGMINLLIVGAGEAANLFIKGLLNYDKNQYHIIGLIDDDISKVGYIMQGYKVLGNRHYIKEACKKYKVNEILLAIPSIDKVNKRELLEICRETGCKTKLMPSSIMMLDKISHFGIRDIQVEDLLARDEIKLDNQNISAYVEGCTVLVTGGGGSIGSEICRQIAKYRPSKLIVLDIYENSIYDLQQQFLEEYPKIPLELVIASVRDKVRLDNIFARFKPEVVFHAAAHKHVPLMEDNAGEALKNNVMGTLNVAEASGKHQVKKFVLISSDKAVNPTNVMGATKRICEMIIQAINVESKTEFVAVRFGNVLGSNGSVIPLFKRQIDKGGPITLTHKDITRYFMTIPEASQLVLEAGSYAGGGEIFVLDMGEPVRIYDLAVNLIRLAGYEVDRDIKIKIVGLRPGEKLYEELLTSEEGLSRTGNQKIYIAKPSEFDFELLKLKIYKLCALSDNEDTERIKEIIGELVPTYVRESRKQKSNIVIQQNLQEVGVIQV